MGSDYDAFAKLAGIAAAAGRMYANDGILYAKRGAGAAAGAESRTVAARGRGDQIKKTLGNLLYNSG
jgi:hypothetical protein